MKGEAIITVKDKNGNIKTQVKETNLVFDIPKEIVKQIIQNIDLGENNSTSSSPNISSYASNPISVAISYDTWFRSIFINDETCSEVNYKDWKMPVLYGGEYVSQNTSNKRYAYYDTASSSRTENRLKKVYIWNQCPEFLMKSINLKHDMNAYYITFTSNSSSGTAASYILRKKGQYFFKPFEPYYCNNVSGNKYANNLLTKSTFYWYSSGGYRIFNNTPISYYKTSGNGNAVNTAIIPLKNNLVTNREEIACLSKEQYIDSIISSTDTSIKYLNIINANTGEIERSFPLTQFDGFTGYSSSNPYQYIYNIKIIPTDFGNFIMMPKNTSTNTWFIWQIPEEATNDTIPLYITNALNASYTYMNGNYQNVFVLNEYIFMLCNGNTNIKKTIKLNDIREISEPTDEDKITTYDYVPFNISSTYYSSTGLSSGDNNCAYQCNKYYDLTCVNAAYWETWYNTTVLNLATPIQISEGDTLTVEYTITAN